uniref:Plastocyanin-like domain-containing protein n=2 Tax=Rhodnius prolixus TaxID=13249 RepID=A0A905QW98_RHOPR
MSHSRSSDSNDKLCLRKCDGVPRLCYYKFKFLHYTTMSLACGKCPKVKSDCYLPHCVAANGVPRGITAINRMIPGPSIQVCQGDKIVVDLENHLPSDSASIHWHGMRQKGTQYYDGVPQITQCPVGPGETFRYQFFAEEAGTFFYHSHS